MEEKIEIPQSKLKIIVLSILALLFVLVSLMLALEPDTFHTTRFNNSLMLVAIGVFSSLFFGICFYFLVKKIFDDNVGLIIDQKGITDFSSATNVGLIAWDDIIGLETIQIASTKMIMIHTDVPEKYIDPIKNGLVRRSMKANLKMYGSPLSISSNTLKIKFKDLESLIYSEFDKRKLLK